MRIGQTIAGNAAVGHGSAGGVKNIALNAVFAAALRYEHLAGDGMDCDSAYLTCQIQDLADQHRRLVRRDAVSRQRSGIACGSRDRGLYDVQAAIPVLNEVWEVECAIGV